MLLKKLALWVSLSCLSNTFEEDALAIASTALWDFRACGPRELHHWALLTLSWLLKQYVFMTLELWKTSHTVQLMGQSLLTCRCLSCPSFPAVWCSHYFHKTCMHPSHIHTLYSISTLPGTQTLHMQQLLGCVTQTCGNLLTHSPSGWFIIYKPVTNLHYLYLDYDYCFLTQSLIL